MTRVVILYGRPGAGENWRTQRKNLPTESHKGS